MTERDFGAELDALGRDGEAVPGASQTAQGLDDNPFFQVARQWQAGLRAQEYQKAFQGSADEAQKAGAPLEPQGKAKATTETVANPFLQAPGTGTEVRPSKGLLGSVGTLTPEEGRKLAEEKYANAPAETEAARAKLEKAKADLDQFQQSGAPDVYDEYSGQSQSQILKGTLDQAQAEHERAKAKQKLAEDMVAGRAAVPTETATRAYAEQAAQSFGRSAIAEPVKFAGIIGGYLANAAGIGAPSDKVSIQKFGDDGWQRVKDTDGITSEHNLVHRFGENIDTWVKRQFPGDDARQLEMGTKIADMAGFVASLYGAKGLEALAAQGPKALALLSRGVTPTIAAASGGVPQYEAATGKMHPPKGLVADAETGEVKEVDSGEPKVTDNQRLGAFISGSALGLSALLPVESVLGGGAAKGFSGIVRSGGIGAAQMAGYSVASDAIAKGFYDPDRKLGEHAGEDAALGFLFGAGAHTIMDAARSRYSSPEEIDAFLKGVRQKIDQERAAQGKPIFDWMQRTAREGRQPLLEDQSGKGTPQSPQASSTPPEAPKGPEPKGAAPEPTAKPEAETQSPDAAEAAGANDLGEKIGDPGVRTRGVGHLGIVRNIEKLADGTVRTTYAKGKYEQVNGRTEVVDFVNAIREVRPDGSTKITLFNSRGEPIGGGDAYTSSLRKSAEAETPTETAKPVAQDIAPFRESQDPAVRSYSGAPIVGPDGTILSPAPVDGERPKTDAEHEAEFGDMLKQDFHDKLGTYLEARKKSEANPDDRGAYHDMADAEGALVETARISGVPTDRFGGPVTPINSFEDIRRAYQQAGANVPGGERTKTEEQLASATHTVVTPDGSMRVAAKPEIVELGDLKQASGDLQPRDRSRAESEIGVKERAANLDPSRLQASPTSDTGAPVVDENGTILSGNGRSMSIADAYNNPALKEKADAYKASLGPEANNFKQPVLVMRTEGLGDEDKKRFADLSNRSSIAQMSAPERAVRDVKSLGASAFADYKGGDLNSPQNRPFLQDFLKRAVTPNELGAMSKDGELTKEGHDRINAAILGAAYKDPGFLSLALEATDDNVKSLTNAMRDAAGPMAQLNAGIEAGVVKPNMEIAPNLVSAVKLISNLRSRGVKVADYLAQQDAFASPDKKRVDALVTAFYNEDLSRPLSQQKLTEVLNYYASEAIKHQSGGFLPDETQAADVIRAAVKQSRGPDLFSGQGGNNPGSAGQAGTAAKPANLTGSNGDTGTGAKDGGNEVRRPESAPGGGRLESVTDKQKQDFRRLLAGTAKRKDWARELGVSEKELEPLVDDAIKQGLLRKDSKGTIRRTPEAKLISAEPAPNASWVVRNKQTGEVLFETFDPKKVAALNTEKYEAVPIQQYLGDYNRIVKEAGGEPPKPTLTPKVQARTEANIDEFYRVYGRYPTQEVKDYAAALESARGNAAQFEPLLAELKTDKAISKQDALDLANLLGAHAVKSSTKTHALAEIEAMRPEPKGTEPLYALSGFHHGPEKAVEDFQQPRATPEQWRKLIEARPGWKDYVDWTELDKFLDGKKSISKDELLSYMRAHSADLDERVLGGERERDTEIARLDAEIAKHLGAREFESEEAMHASTAELEKLVRQREKLKNQDLAPKFSAHKIPGGVPGSYRELLIRDKSLEGRDLTPEETGQLSKFRGELDAKEQERSRRWFSKGETDLDRSIYDLHKSIDNLEEKSKPKYTSEHFHDQDLGHIRGDTRLLSTGEKTFFAHEFQLDLDQLVRRFGIGPEGAKKAKEIAADPSSSTELKAVANKYVARFGDKGSPNYPFKGDLGLELLVKRALRYAVETGHDAFAIARSDQIGKAVGQDPAKLKLQYDSKIPKYLDKYVKKWGAKVERENILGKSGDPERRQISERIAEANKELADADNEWTRSALQAEILQLRQRGQELLRQKTAESLGTNPIIRITPQMRESVLGGQAYGIGDLGRRTNHVNLARSAIEAGQPYEVPGHISNAIMEAALPHYTHVPDDYHMVVVTGIEPAPNLIDTRNGKETKRVKVHIINPEGEEDSVLLDQRGFFGSRAITLPREGIILLSRLDMSPKLLGTIGGEIHHEISHAIDFMHVLPSDVRSKLLSHSDALGVMSLPHKNFLLYVGDPAWKTSSDLPIWDLYADRYKELPWDVWKWAMESEGIAHLREAYHHDRERLDTEKLLARYGPVLNELEGFYNGEYTGKRGQVEAYTPANVLAAITAYHGSPHDFDRFDLSHIGKGEGAQAFGHGLYFAENEAVGKQYRDQLARTVNTDDPRQMAAAQAANHGNRATAAQYVRHHLETEEAKPNPDNGWIAKYKPVLHALEDNRPLPETAGRLYQVSLDIEPHDLLDWDKTLNQQSDHVKALLPPKALENAGDLLASEWLKKITSHPHFAKDTAQLLRERGIPGIRYLDQGSRTAGEGSRNFVIFDDKLVKITAKDGKPVSDAERSDVLDQTQHGSEPQFALNGQHNFPEPRPLTREDQSTVDAFRRSYLNRKVMSQPVPLAIRRMIAADVEHGSSSFQIAERYGVSPAWIRSAKSRGILNVEPKTDARVPVEFSKDEERAIKAFIRSKAAEPAIPIPEKIRAMMRAYHEAGASPSDIEERFGVRIGGDAHDQLKPRGNLTPLSPEEQMTAAPFRDARLARVKSGFAVQELIPARIKALIRRDYNNGAILADIALRFGLEPKDVRSLIGDDNLRTGEPGLGVHMTGGHTFNPTTQKWDGFGVEPRDMSTAEQALADNYRELRKNLTAQGRKYIPTPPAVRDGILADISHGMTANEIAARWGLNGSSVKNYAGGHTTLSGENNKPRDVAEQPASSKSVAQVSPERRGQIAAHLEYVNDDVEGAATKFRTSPEVVSRILDELNRNGGKMSSVSAQTAFRAAKREIEANGNGQPLFALSGGEHDQTQTPAFRKWFGDSKVVDAQGKPLVVYHGTNAADIEAFDPKRIGSKTDAGWLGHGFNFSSDKSVAEAYGNKQIPVYLSAQNLYNMNGKNFAKMLEQHGGPKGFSEWLRQNGYDGAKMWSQYMVLDPSQIKSVIGNKGTFDPKDSRIQYALSGGSGGAGEGTLKLLSRDEQKLIDDYNAARKEAGGHGGSRVRLPNEIRDLIRADSENGASVAQIAERYNLDRGFLWHVLNGKDSKRGGRLVDLAPEEEKLLSEFKQARDRVRRGAEGRITEPIANLIQRDYDNGAPVPDIMERYGIGDNVVRKYGKHGTLPRQVYAPHSKPLYALSGGSGDAGEPPSEISALSETIADLKSSLGMPETQGRHKFTVGGEGRKVHADSTDTTAPKALSDLDEIARTGPDRLDKLFGEDLADLKAEGAAELAPMSDPKAPDKVDGGFDEFFRHYIKNPDAAKAQAPHFYQDFEDFLDAHNPDLLQAFERLQQSMESPGVQDSLRSAAIDPYFQRTFGQTRDELFASLTKAGEGYRRAISQSEILKNRDMAQANAYLRTLPETLRTYVLFNDKREVAKLHPVNRAKDIAKIIQGMQREIIDNQLKDTANGGRIYLGPAKADAVNDLLMHLAGVELHDTFAFMGDPQFEGQPEIGTRPTLNEISAADPHVYAEYHRRLEKAKVQNWAAVKGFFMETARDLDARWRENAEATAIFGGGDGGEPPSTPPKTAASATPGPRRNLGVDASTPSFAKQFANGWVKWLQPERFSDKALRADPRFAQYKAATAQEKDAIIKQGDESYKRWAKVPQAEQLAYIDAVEKGDLGGLPDWQRKEAIRHRQLLDRAFKDEKEAGSKAEFVDEYMPHIWENPKEAREVMQSLSSVENLGPKWFQKARYYDLIQQGLDHGLKLKTSNPEDLVSMRLLAGADMRQRMYLLNALDKEYGLATRAKGASSDLVQSGWRAVNAPDREQWLIARDVQPLWENAVIAKGLWAHEGWQGQFFRGWMGLKNVWTPIKLSLSLFHPLHVLHINMAEQMARAWVQAGHGKLYEAGKSIGKIADLYPKEGREARAAWVKTKEERTPNEQAIVDLMTEGGFSPQLSEQLKIAAGRQFTKAIAERSLWTPFLALKRGLEKTQGVIFEKWIPNLKAAAFLNDAATFADAFPDKFNDPIQRKLALRAIGKSIDNRYGEMFYGTLFWNRTLKDAGIGAFLSLGWNLGFAREFGGGLLSPIVKAAEKASGKKSGKERETIREAQNKTAFVLSYSSSALILTALMTYMFTGDEPNEFLDYIFARVGGLNPDGSRRRISNMFYTREAPMLAKHIQEEGGGLHGTVSGAANMLFNKLLISPFIEMFNNRDYFGRDIYDVNAPEYKQAYQFARHILLDQFSPITFTGAKRALQTGGTWQKDVPLSFLGFGPAPSYASRTATQNRIAYLFQRHVSAYSRPEPQTDPDEARRDARQAFKLAQANGDSEGMAAATKKIAELAVQQHEKAKIPAMAGDILMFKKLPEADQIAILESAPQDEAKKYLFHVHPKVYSDPVFMRWRDRQQKSNATVH